MTQSHPEPTPEQAQALRQAQSAIGALKGGLYDAPHGPARDVALDLFHTLAHLVNGNSLRYGTFFTSDRVEILRRLNEAMQRITHGLADQAEREQQ